MGKNRRFCFLNGDRYTFVLTLDLNEKSSVQEIVGDVTHLTRHYKGCPPLLVCNLVSVDILLAAWGLVTRTAADRYGPKC